MSDSTSTAARPSARPRAVWVDDARGLGIVLVVSGHALGGLQSAGIASPDSGYGLAFRLIYSFHMPLFFLLSGLFADRFLSGAMAGHVSKSLVRLGYPYIVWSIVTVGVIMSLGQLVNAPVAPSLAPFLAIPWSPPSQLWFLYALFAIQLVYIFAARWVGFVALFFVLAALRLIPAFVAMPDIATLTLTYGIFFALGALVAKPLFALAGSTSRRTLLALAVAAGAAWLAAVLLALQAGFHYLSLAMIPASLAGTAAMLLLAMTLPSAIEPVVRYLGSISMPIYLAHVLFVAGTRIVLAKLFGIDNPALLLPLLVASGIVGPMILWEVSRRLKCERLLGFA